MFSGKQKFPDSSPSFSVDKMSNRFMIKSLVGKFRCVEAVVAKTPNGSSIIYGVFGLKDENRRETFELN